MQLLKKIISPITKAETSFLKNSSLTLDTMKLMIPFSSLNSEKVKNLKFSKFVPSNKSLTF
jgi:hypothetical protein